MTSLQPPYQEAGARDATSRFRQEQAELAPVPSKKGEPSSWARLREAGERLTGGGIRALGKRLLLRFVRRLMGMVMRRPRLLALSHAILKRFPGATWWLNRLAAIADPYAGRIYIPSGRLSNYVDPITMTLSASARVIYLRLRAAASETGSWNSS
ncbi:MAG: hypothetical protein JO066_00305 [Verrucomicrobia bacterium]|nr:hypothetical protein [Verrucomicrobiota bacterium]MBV9297393.1 hypothetical protein [Verrucomicrobiota bacterium]